MHDPQVIRRRVVVTDDRQPVCTNRDRGASVPWVSVQPRPGDAGAIGVVAMGSPQVESWYAMNGKPSLPIVMEVHDGAIPGCTVRMVR